MDISNAPSGLALQTPLQPWGGGLDHIVTPQTSTYGCYPISALVTPSRCLDKLCVV